MPHPSSDVGRDGPPGRGTRLRPTSMRHPLRWLGSRVNHRRGVVSPAGVPDGANEVLDRLSTLPLSVWTYRFDHESVRHLGPMAQDFAATFGLGSSDRTIAGVDANGVCMASIQALYRRLADLEAELDRVRRSVESRQTSPDD